MAASDPVTAVANALVGIAGAVTPFINDALAQKYDTQYRQRLSEWSSIVAQADSSVRADSIRAYLDKLFADADTSGGGLGDDISLPLSDFNALINIAAGKIRDDQRLAAIQFKQTSA